MKIIKFRAWNNDEGMREVLTWRFKEGFINTPKEVSDVSDFQIMQFTGLYDRKKVEIYEGDIITYTTYYEDDILKGVIEYNEEKGCYGILSDDYLKHPEKYPFNENPFFNEYINRFDFLYKCGGRGYHYGIENINIINVIGNIYETPELINESKRHV